MRNTVIVTFAALGLAACTPSGPSPADHTTAPGHAVGSGPSRLENVGGQQEVAHPATGQGVGGGVATLHPTGAGPEVTRAPGRGRGAGSPAGGRITGGTGGGGPDVEHGHEGSPRTR